LHAEKAYLHASLQLKQELRLRLLPYGWIKKVADPALIPRLPGLKETVTKSCLFNFMKKW
jgi:hypothetical protein